MDPWQPHIIVALTTLFIISIFDIHQKRIPNKILFSSIALHFILSFFYSYSFNNQVVALLILLLLILLIVFERSSQWVLAKIGMGDIKLILYLIWIFTGAISWKVWLITLSLISLLFIFWLGVRKKGLDHQIAFAPLASTATLISLFLYNE